LCLIEAATAKEDPFHHAEPIQALCPSPPQPGCRLVHLNLHVLSRDLGSLFAQRPLITGESEDEYDDLLSKVTSAVAPVDMIEAVWVKHIVDLIWEAQRLRRLKPASLWWAAPKWRR
jgi:hypothetical protein